MFEATDLSVLDREAEAPHLRLDAVFQAPVIRRTMVDLFAGCGGLSLGFEQAGFSPVFVNELNDDARATYLANRPEKLFNGKSLAQNPELVSADIRELSGKKLGEVKAHLTSLGVGLDFEETENLDIVAGGPPCQGYSGIGHRRSYAVDKVKLPSNRLYENMALVIRSLRPRIFLFENVKGLLSSRWTASGEKGEIWRDVLDHFQQLGKEAGYQIRWSLVYAKDYGVPQNRPRVLLVGLRNDLVAKLKDRIWPEADVNDAVRSGFLPRHGKDIAPDLEEIFADLIDGSIPKRLRNRDFGERFSTLVYPRPAKTPWQHYFRPGNLANVLAPLEEQDYSRHSAKVVEKFSAMIKSGGVIPPEFQTKKFAQRVLPRRWGNAGPSITACSLADDYVHFEQPRSLTVREWARLQTFPDWYKFTGSRTTGGLRRAGNPQAGNFDREAPKYTQIGNAVPVKLAEAVALHFEQLLVAAGY
jgi:DNA (cytosine-5)-methyltransferase 1